MPIYEYECATCGHRFEKMVKIGAAAPPCPGCASAEVVKRISASGFILKGGGWYKDHYGLKPGDKGGDAKADAKTDAKPDAKAAASEGKSEAKTTPAPAPKPAAAE